MSTPPQPPLPPSPTLSLVSLDGQQVLEFLRTENQRQRDFFTDLFTKASWVLGVVALIVGGAAAALGIKTINEAKQSAETAAQAAVQERLKELRPQIDSEVSIGVASEFATPKIDGIVQDAARQATATTANKIIRSEVHDQVATAVNSEQRTIDRTLTAASEEAVSRVQGTIQQHADTAVARIVDDRVNPELRRLRTFSDLTAAVALARAGDGSGFDRLVLMGNEASSPEIQRAAKATIDSITTQMIYGFNSAQAGCSDAPPPYQRPLQTVATYEEEISDKSITKRTNAALCLGRVGDLISAGQDKKSIRSSMDVLFRVMSNDPDLNVRKAAFWSFVGIGGWVYQHESIASEVHLFDNASNAKWWRENRARFIVP